MSHNIFEEPIGYRPLDPGELIIDPIIFSIKIDRALPHSEDCYMEEIDGKWIAHESDFSEEETAFKTQLKPILDQYDVVTYFIELYSLVFGFKKVSRDESVEKAISVFEAIKSNAEDGVNVELSFSTAGIDEYADVYSNMESHMRDVNFPNVLSGYVRYLDIEHYEHWKKGDTSLVDAYYDSLPEVENIEKPIISIMPDFGNGPYAWKTEQKEPFPVGCNIADAVVGFDDKYHVPKDLQKRFGKWVIKFKNECKDKEFDWDKFHEDGIYLAIDLREALDHKYEVRYIKPREDPDCDKGKRVVIFY